MGGAGVVYSHTPSLWGGVCTDIRRGAVLAQGKAFARVAAPSHTWGLLCWAVSVGGRARAATVPFPPRPGLGPTWRSNPEGAMATPQLQCIQSRKWLIGSMPAAETKNAKFHLKMYLRVRPPARASGH